jgi:hypothetical protein
MISIDKELALTLATEDLHRVLSPAIQKRDGKAFIDYVGRKCDRSGTGTVCAALFGLMSALLKAQRHQDLFWMLYQMSINKGFEDITARFWIGLAQRNYLWGEGSDEI